VAYSPQFAVQNRPLRTKDGGWRNKEGRKGNKEE
jgi:hypothetical protein